MRKKKRGILMALMLTVFSVLGIQPSVAFAAGALTTEIPVEVSLSGTLPEEEEDFAILLQAGDASNPMPGGSAGDVYELTVTGEGAKSFPAIQFSALGVYHYTISMRSGANGDCTYDTTVYHLTVYVTNNEAGGLGAVSVLYKNEESDKLECAAFHNVYETEPETEPQTEPETEPQTEPETEPQTDPQTEPETKPQTEPQTEKPGDGSAPKTGDDTDLLWWVSLMGIAAIAAAGAGITLAYKTKRNGKNG